MTESFLSAALLGQVPAWWIKTAAMYHSPEKHFYHKKEFDSFFHLPFKKSILHIRWDCDGAVRKEDVL